MSVNRRNIRSLHLTQFGVQSVSQSYGWGQNFASTLEVGALVGRQQPG